VHPPKRAVVARVGYHCDHVPVRVVNLVRPIAVEARKSNMSPAASLRCGSAIRAIHAPRRHRRRRTRLVWRTIPVMTSPHRQPRPRQAHSIGPGCKSVAHGSARSKSGIERPKQSRIAEWLG
jgi:hypothetical protein